MVSGALIGVWPTMLIWLGGCFREYGWRGCGAEGVGRGKRIATGAKWSAWDDLLLRISSPWPAPVCAQAGMS